MNCKACGEPIPSHLLRKDSFSCPACGRTYYRGSKPTGASSAKSPSRASDKRATRSKAPMETPKWLMAAIAALLVLVLAVGGVWLITKRGGSGVSGTISLAKLSKSKDQTVTVEIPRQRGNYMVATESSEISVVFAVKDKTETSFNLVAHNLSSKSRNLTVSWVLMPCKVSE